MRMVRKAQPVQEIARACFGDARVHGPKPGDELEITLLFRGTEKPPPGDFVIEPYWGGYEKDRLVGAMIDSDLQPYIVGVALIGIILLITSSILAIDIARRAGQT